MNAVADQSQSPRQPHARSVSDEFSDPNSDEALIAINEANWQDSNPSRNGERGLSDWSSDSDDSEADSVFSWTELHSEKADGFHAELQERVGSLMGDTGLADFALLNPEVQGDADEMLNAKSCNCDANGRWWEQHRQSWNVNITLAAATVEIVLHESVVAIFGDHLVFSCTSDQRRAVRMQMCETLVKWWRALRQECTNSLAVVSQVGTEATMGSEAQPMAREGGASSTTNGDVGYSSGGEEAAEAPTATDNRQEGSARTVVGPGRGGAGVSDSQLTPLQRQVLLKYVEHYLEATTQHSSSPALDVDIVKVALQ